MPIARISAVLLTAMFLSSVAWSARAQKAPTGVPAQTVTGPQTQGSGSSGPGQGQAGRKDGVDLNSASSEDLAKLPGMTTQRVAAVVRGRPYANADELVSRRILKASTFERIKPYIVVR